MFEKNKRIKYGYNRLSSLSSITTGRLNEDPPLDKNYCPPISQIVRLK